MIAGIIYLENGFCVLRFSLTDYLISILVRKSLDLIESLLRLAEVGQYEQVKQLFSFPIKHCPDMLVLALLQIKTSWHTLRHELISTLMPIFLGNHPNSAIILHYAWHGQVRYDHFFVLIINIKTFLLICVVGVQQSECYTYTYSFFQILFHTCHFRVLSRASFAVQ